jgi:hypothetical protein
MQSKTPKFDVKIEEILNSLVPHTRTCGDCKKDFDIASEDITFYKMFRVPPPKLCPDCRHRRRLSFVNYSNIYKRKCDVPGHTESMLSLVAPVIPWITYDYDTYYSDQWDPISYGKDIDLDKPFFDQYLEILKVIPQPGVKRGVNCINSDFCFHGESLRDGYYVFGGRRSENILYSASIYDSKNIIDSYFLRDVDTGYSNVTTSDCYKCFFAYFSSNCIDCSFVYDCRNCQNCFGCVNLRNKNYCWFNEQLTKEEYFKRLSEVDLGSRKVMKEYQEKFWNFVKENPIRAVRNYQSVNVSGNDIKRSKDCHNVFQTEDSENVRHSSFAIFKMKDSMDVGFSGRAERNYEAQNTSAHSSNMKFAYNAKESKDCEYVMTCKNCSDCFGCVGLNNASYMIFNKKYSSEAYWEKLDEVKINMLENGEYGEFFPMSFSPLAYNSSMANLLYPMTEDEAKARNLYWQPEINTDLKDLKSISANELPDNVKDVTDDVCDLVIIGETSNKPFRFIKREIDFYKRYNIALPSDTPYQRIIDRFKILDNFKTYQENCFSCGTEILSSHKKTDGYKPYCEDCYQKEIL